MSIYRLLRSLKGFLREYKNINYLSGAASSRDVFFRCQISCAHKEQVVASKNYSCNVHCLKSYPGMLTLLVCHANTDFMRISLVFKKIILAIFWPRLSKVKIFVFFSIFGQGYRWWKFLVFSSFLAKVTKGESFCFSWSFFSKDNNGESFLFWAFLAKDTNGESFVFSLSFLAKDANGKSFCFS